MDDASRADADRLEVRFKRFTFSPLRDCILWSGHLTKMGYPVLYQTSGQTIYAHRYAWERENGPLGDLTIDHLCMVRCCVNLAHLEAVPLTENMARMNRRRTTCPKGHEYDGVDNRGTRTCGTCKRARDNARYARLHPYMSKPGAPTCHRGHLLTEGNLEPRNDGHRRCLTCARAYRKNRWARAKDGAVSEKPDGR
jgi:hypothetical protein